MHYKYVSHEVKNHCAKAKSTSQIMKNRQDKVLLQLCFLKFIIKKKHLAMPLKRDIKKFLRFPKITLLWLGNNQ